MESPQLLRGRVALVTGAARGIGRGIALCLAEHGAAVGINDLQGTDLARVADEIEAIGGRGMTSPGSVASIDDVDAFVGQVERELGPIDILVNNAGINRDATLAKMTLEQWQHVIDVDLTGEFLCLKRVLPGMRERQWGRIINISSASWLGNFGQANYAAAKAGVVGLTKTAARELGKYGITCNAICPGFIDTNMTRALPPEVWDQVVARIPARRVGTPEDVAGAVLWLASPYATYINGEVINVGGGMVL